MQVQRIRLQNFCQHADTTVEFVPGLNMICGPNGSGKSNLLRGLQLAFTGTAGGKRNKDQNIRQHSTGPAVIDVDLQHGNSQIHVTRGLRPQENRLQICGADSGDALEITGFDPVNAELCRLLDTQPQHLRDYVFVAQRGIDNLFDKSPADRTASLAALFGLAHVESIWQTLSSFISGIVMPTTAFDAAALTEQVTRTQAAVDSLNREITQLGLPADPDAAIAALDATIAAITKHMALSTELLDVQTRQTAAATQVAMLDQQRQELEADIAVLTAAQTDMAPAVAEANMKLAQWMTYEASLNEAAALQREIEMFDKRWAGKLNPPVKPAVDRLDKLAELQHCAELQRDLQATESALQGLEKTPKTCPTCKQAMPNAAAVRARIDELQSKRLALIAALRPLQERQRVYAEYDIAVKDYTRRLEDFQREQASLETRKANLVKWVCPAGTQDECRAVIAQAQECADGLADLQAALRVCEQKLARDTRTREYHDARIAQISTELAQLPVSARLEAPVDLPMQARKEHAQISRVAIVDAVRKRQTLEIAIAAKSAELQSAREKLADIAHTRAQADATARARDHLHKIRALLHRNEVPRVVTHAYITQMLTEINDILTIFDAPFQVGLDENLGFLATFHGGGRVQPDSALSVGERIILALAFRIVINATFAGQVGLLVLDEPTVGLDEHNISCLPLALERLRKYSQQRGLQVLFVTHDRQLAYVFDRTIELAA